MASLARVLQQEFARIAPPEWSVVPEAPVVQAADLHSRLGFQPRVDLLLERRDGRRKLWLEFEISRADPVANHAKFATVHLYQPFGPRDTFVSMISSHVDRGRRNLAANAVEVMRRIGIDAFQMPLFPHLGPDDVKRLNHLDFERLRRDAPDVRPELERLLAIVEPALPGDRARIHFASDVLDVVLNIDAWNSQIGTQGGAGAWGRRTVQYYACDPTRQAFAPSKFCAFVPVSVGVAAARSMSIGTYASLDESEPRFDGHRARNHLEKRLGMVLVARGMDAELDAWFDRWLTGVGAAITVNPRGAVYLVPPRWGWGEHP